MPAIISVINVHQPLLQHLVRSTIPRSRDDFQILPLESRLAVDEMSEYKIFDAHSKYRNVVSDGGLKVMFKG